MSDKLSSKWWTESWNPVSGCSPISDGCTFCYARTAAGSMKMRGKFGYDKITPFAVTYHKDKLDKPLHWKKPRRIFVCSMGDLFHENVEDEWLDCIFSVIAAAPQHKYMILTKRPGRMKEYLTYRQRNLDMSNIWLGVTAENGRMLYFRLPILNSIRAGGYFLSIEPLLEHIPLTIPVPDIKTGLGIIPLGVIDFVIVGGETGPGSRVVKEEWVNSVLMECTKERVPVWFKQWGRTHAEVDKLVDGEIIHQLPKGLIV